MSDDDLDPVVVPFVSIASNGGPYPDEPFFAGWEIGRLEGDLDHARAVGTVPAGRWIREANLRQADLAAMGHRFVMTVHRARPGDPADGTAWVTFS